MRQTVFVVAKKFVHWTGIENRYGRDGPNDWLYAFVKALRASALQAIQTFLDGGRNRRSQRFACCLGKLSGQPIRLRVFDAVRQLSRKVADF